MSKYCVSDERVAVNHSTALGVLIVVSVFAATARANSERLLATGGRDADRRRRWRPPGSLGADHGTGNQLGSGRERGLYYVGPQHFSLTSCGVAVCWRTEQIARDFQVGGRPPSELTTRTPRADDHVHLLPNVPLEPSPRAYEWPLQAGHHCAAGGNRGRAPDSRLLRAAVRANGCGASGRSANPRRRTGSRHVHVGGRAGDGTFGGRNEDCSRA
jgi:hypothetical protein